VFDEPELHVIKFPRNPEREAERERQHAQMLCRYRGQVAMTLIELGLNPGEVTAWSESILDRLFIVLPREGGEPCRCSCHPRLPDSDLHDYGFACSCQLTTEERRRHADEWQANLAALWNSPEAAAERAQRQAERTSWRAGWPVSPTS
jgi:hypothetical protein